VAASKRPFNHPRRTPSKFRWWHAVAVIGMIAAVFLLLERLKSGHRPATEVALPPSTQLQQPQAVLPDYGQKNYTSAHALPPAKKGAHRTLAGKGTVAIIIDDMGSSQQEARQLLAINIPLTFAIIPGLPKATAVAQAAAAAGMKVMVHLPMEPQGYPQQRLEANGLLVAYSAEEIAARTEALLAAVPAAVGANNHMGSRFTEDEEKMLPVLQVLKARGLFFVDSRTSPRSTGFALAGRLGVKTATRNVFLDNEQDVAAIRRQLYAAAEMARRKGGGVIAICHPHPATIKALQETLPELQKSGINFVAAGDIVR